MATYTTRQGDTWDMIAWLVYGSESYAQAMMRQNREHIDTLVFDGGVELELPPIVAETPVGLPPWKG
jgi:phage tail protein X